MAEWRPAVSLRISPWLILAVRHVVPSRYNEHFHEMRERDELARHPHPTLAADQLAAVVAHAGDEHAAGTDVEPVDARAHDSVRSSSGEAPVRYPVLVTRAR